LLGHVASHGVPRGGKAGAGVERIAGPLSKPPNSIVFNNLVHPFAALKPRSQTNQGTSTAHTICNSLILGYGCQRLMSHKPLVLSETIKCWDYITFSGETPGHVTRYRLPSIALDKSALALYDPRLVLGRGLIRLYAINWRDASSIWSVVDKGSDMIFARAMHAVC
jgi:hypothetical protein